MASGADVSVPTTENTLVQLFQDQHPGEELCQAVYGLQPHVRVRVLTIWQQKMAQGVITNPLQYLSGIIKRETNPAGARQAGPYNRMQHTQVAPQPLSTGRPVASPQHHMPPALPTRPGWVTEAWAHINQPGKLIRGLSLVVGENAMQSIAALPQHVQLAMLASLLLTPQAWAMPGASLQAMAAVATSFPPLVSPSAQSHATRANNKSLIVVQVGPSYGVEYLILEAVLHELQDSGLHYRVQQKVAFITGVEWQFAVPHLVQAMNSPSVELHTDPSQYMAAITALHTSLRASESVVLVMVTLPHGDGKTGGCTAFPAHHSAASQAFWAALRTVRLMQDLPPTRYAEIIFEQDHKASLTDNAMYKIFGATHRVNKAMTKVPAPQWLMHTWPVLPSNDVPERKIEPYPNANVFHESMIKVAQGLGADVELPSLSSLEHYWDQLHFAPADAPGEIPKPVGMDSLFAQGTSSPGRGMRLLNREEFTHIWGLSGWNLAALFERSSTCRGRIVSATGLAAHNTTPEAQAQTCGTTRWCVGCAQWYHALLSCPPPHAWAHLSDLLTQCRMETQAPVRPDRTLLETLCSHECNGTGCGAF